MLKVQKTLNQVFKRATCSNMYVARCNFYVAHFTTYNLGCDIWGWIAFMRLTKNVDEEFS